jgi:dTDP-4-dehydrorhamnose 3,5-epimerase-like enzyme
MGDSGLTILELKDSGDARGNSFPVPADWFSNTFPVRDVHITTVLPGHIRGNHYHVARHEVLIVIFTTSGRYIGITALRPPSAADNSTVMVRS